MLQLLICLNHYRVQLSKLLKSTLIFFMERKGTTSSKVMLQGELFLVHFPKNTTLPTSRDENV